MNALATEVNLGPNRLPIELIATDRILLSWAASVGDGSDNSFAWQEVRRAKVPPLTFDAAIVVDQLVCRSPYRQLTELWYRKPDPREAIARRLGIPENTIYPLWKSALRLFKYRFEACPLSDLRKLVAADHRAAFVRGVLARKVELADG